MKKRDFQFLSADKQTKINAVKWEPDGKELKGILQISHGMVEYVERYEKFAEFMVQQGFLVAGNDHLGHGKSVTSESQWGYFAPKNGSDIVVEDIDHIRRMMETEHPGIPYFILGHSMGSFMARRYLMTYGMDLDGAVICGTGSQGWLVLAAGTIVAGGMRLLLGDRYRSQFLEMSAFGAYQKRIPDPRTRSDWMTRDTGIVDFCRNNKYCSFLFTVNGYRTLFEVLAFIQQKKNIDRIPAELPLFFIAGGQDPVGHYGADVRKVAS